MYIGIIFPLVILIKNIVLKLLYFFLNVLISTRFVCIVDISPEISLIKPNLFLRVICPDNRCQADTGGD